MAKDRRRERRRFLVKVLVLVFILLPACRPSPAPSPILQKVSETAPAELIPSQTEVISPPSATSTLTITNPPTETPFPTTTSTPSITPTPDPLWEYTIDYLANRDYGGGEIEIVETYAENSLFTRYIYKYPSDGLDIYGFLNVPQGDGPFPVIIALHGYIDPAIYGTIDYTTGYADAYARAGFLVLHPNLRNYPPSDDGDNLYRVGMAVDALNLIALVKEFGGEPGPLEKADAGFIGMWGHSMGGGVTTRVITVSDDVDAAVLYAAMSGDEKQNFEAILQWSDGLRGNEELETSEDDLTRISPAGYFENISAAVSIHHGRADALVPLRWSVATCEQMVALQITVQCIYYPGMPHTFYGDGNQSFIDSTVAFFNQWLRP